MADELFQDELDEIEALPGVHKRAGYVYVMHAESTNRIKIGRTHDVEARLVDMQTHCPFPVHVLYAVYCEDAPALESLLHGAMDHYRVNGEWFAMPDDAVVCLDLLGLLYKKTNSAAMLASDAHAQVVPIWDDRLPSLNEMILTHLVEHTAVTITEMAVALGYTGKRYGTLRTCVHRLWKKGCIGRRGIGTYFCLRKGTEAIREHE